MSDESTYDNERRVSVRWSSTQQAPCHFVTFDQILCRWAQVVNVSADGIALLLPCAFERGTELVLELPCKDLLNARIASARVIHCSRHDDASWSIGCAFEHPLSPEDLTTLV